MPATYFERLIAESPTRVWVNNPTAEEVGLALAQGAVGSTTNPAFGGGLLRRAPEEVLPVIAECLALSDDDRVVADLLQHRLVGKIAERFLPVHVATDGKLGYVSIQGSPETDMDAECIWEEAKAGHAIGPNVAPKLPATIPGFSAMERAVQAQWPVIVTEVFSVDQVIMACELYLKTTRRTGVRSPFFMSPITGILGDHLKKLAARDGLDVAPWVMDMAGVGLARRCAAVVAERDYPVTLLFGGSRTQYDLTGLVGAAHHATINWSTFAELIASDAPIERTIDQPLEPEVERILLSTFPDMWKGWEEGRLAPQEFEDFGPVQHFRDSFLAGWHSVLAMVADRRAIAVA